MANEKKEEDLSNYNSLHTSCHYFIRLKYDDRPLQLGLEKNSNNIYSTRNCVIQEGKKHQTESL